MTLTNWHVIGRAVEGCFIVCDLNYNVVYVNDTATKLLGVSASTLFNKSLTDVFITTDPSATSLPIEIVESIDAGSPCFLKTSTRPYRYLKAIARKVVLDASDYIVVNLKEIPEVSSTTEQLEIAEQYSITLLDTVLDGLITIDKQGLIQEFNKSAERIFGYLMEEVRGRNVKMLMPAPYHQEHDQYLGNYHATHQRKVIGVGRQVSAQRKDGTIFPIELGVNEMIVAGKVTYVGTIRDISERIEAEKEIRSYIEALKQSNQALDQFAYIASHDLKEPLRGLANNARFLEDDYKNVLDEAGIKRLTRMRFLCGRMEELVTSLLYYSRLGRQELAIERKNISEILQNVIELTVPEDTQDILITYTSSLPTILCDVPRTTELFRNLISNAIKYNEQAKKHIEIGFSKALNPHNQCVEDAFYVKDNGIGIDKKFFNDIFKIFKRLNEEDDDKRGTGVGLTFVKKIVERHQGDIWLTSELGKGTAFYFTLRLEKLS